MSSRITVSEFADASSKRATAFLKGRREEFEAMTFTTRSWGQFIRLLIGAGVTFSDLSEFGDDVHVMGWISGHLQPSDRDRTRVVTYAFNRFMA